MRMSWYMAIDAWGIDNPNAVITVLHHNNNNNNASQKNHSSNLSNPWGHHYPMPTTLSVRLLLNDRLSVARGSGIAVATS